MIKFIPNLFTLLNLSSGCIGVVFAFTTDLRMVSIMVFISLILDYFDGAAARLLDARSPIGKELDSLADLISFGLLPALIAYMLLHSSPYSSWAYISFLITVFSAYRLAKFNIDERQSVNFIGLPTPANALFWSSFPLIIFGDHSNSVGSALFNVMSNPLFIMACILLFSYLLIAELPLFSLKFKNLSWKDNKDRHLFLLSSLILFLALSYYALPFIIILYLLISVVTQKLKSA
jgi:CDP-diacylglycerol--serine O-phosphatidyltransferase